MKNLVSRLKEAVVIGTLAAFVSGCQPCVRENLSRDSALYSEVPITQNREYRNLGNTRFQSDDTFDDLTSLASVEEYPIEDSKYTLVHIRQRHMATNNSMNPILIKRVEENQGDIYRILEKIYAKNQSIQLYPEGLTLEKEDYLNSLALNEKSRLKDYFSYLVLDDPLDRKLFWDNLDQNLNFCGVMLFSMDKEIPVYALELSSINQLAKQMYRQGIKGKEVFDDREDFALKRISETSNKELAITDFGCNHNFLDNVNKWNSKHPDKKFSLVVINPYSLLH